MAHDHLWGNLNELAALPDVELLAGADYNPALRQRFTERSGCDKVYGHYETLLDAEKPDAVLVFSATAELADIVIINDADEGALREALEWLLKPVES